MHDAADMPSVEFPPMKRAAIHYKMQIRILFFANGNDALHPHRRRPAEAIRFHRASNLRPDGPRDHLRVRRAESIRHVNLLRLEICPHTRRAQLLGAELRAGISQLQETIRVPQRGLKTAGGFPAEGEIRQRNPPLKPGPLPVMPPPPHFGGDHRWLCELE